MRNDIYLEDMLEVTNNSVYKLTTLIAKRALELADGTKPLIEKPKSKPLDNAIREVLEGKVKIKEKKT